MNYSVTVSPIISIYNFVVRHLRHKNAPRRCVILIIFAQQITSGQNERVSRYYRGCSSNTKILMAVMAHCKIRKVQNSRAIESASRKPSTTLITA